ncbi:hypothetical protein Cs7R123_67300 [Catellatospora sp. TT07R-123]|uniref:hypothetical protein n=1 Tax=Catellatospora sp. TT07R-123 TaxID=2733863 RepID=UPI001B1F5157|nr:hypothetical protein [Catellatospora sp. TT07R-123]GHJ49388.1 hypothetical protein Cs7R123_67300 [Catellatospora sp. TT07R-123]
MSVYPHFDLSTGEQRTDQWTEQPDGFGGILHALDVQSRAIDAQTAGGRRGGRPFAPDDVFALGRERLRRQQAIDDKLGHGMGTLPDRFFDEPVAAGPHRGAVLDRAAFASGLARLRVAWT